MRSVRLSQLDPIADGLDHPEGIALGPDGMLYAGGELGQVYRIDPADGHYEQIADTGGSALGVTLDARGSVYVCNPGRRSVIRVDTRDGSSETWCDSAAGEPLLLPNWAAFADDGSMWLSDSGTPSREVCNGRLLHVPVGGGDAEVIDVEPLHFPNGLCVASDGCLHWVESFRPSLRRLTDRGVELVAELPGVVPDGIVQDAEEGFVVSCFYPYRLMYVAPGGGLVLLLDDPFGIYMPMPTNATYFGPELEKLAIACCASGEIKALPAPAVGRPLHLP